MILPTIKSVIANAEIKAGEGKLKGDTFQDWDGVVCLIGCAFPDYSFPGESAAKSKIREEFGIPNIVQETAEWIFESLYNSQKDMDPYSHEDFAIDFWFAVEAIDDYATALAYIDRCFTRRFGHGYLEDARSHASKFIEVLWQCT